MKQIWKYRLELGTCIIGMPKGSEILTVQNQYEVAYVWALVDPNKEVEERIFEVIGTGHNIEPSKNKRKYINTFQLQGGFLVFHVFEIIE